MNQSGLMRHSSALSTQLLITSAGLRIGLTTMTTWFLLPPIPKIEFVPPFLVVKIFVAIRVAFRKNASISKGLQHFGRTFIRYRSHKNTVSGRTFIRYRAIRLPSFPHLHRRSVSNALRELRGSLRIDINFYPPWYTYCMPL